MAKKVAFMQGNEAAAHGALYAGCKFFAGYPITPSTEVAEVMSAELPKVGGKFIQMEDEIGAMAAIIGASLTGLKTLTSTSGPGLSLKQENIGYAAGAEIDVPRNPADRELEDLVSRFERRDHRVDHGRENGAHAVAVGKVLPDNGAQFDFIAFAQKTWQRQIDQERFGYFDCLRCVTAELIRFRLAYCHDAIGRQVIRRDELKIHLAISAGFQASLPVRESAKFFPNIFDIRERLLSAIADNESFLGQTEFGEVLDITVQRLVSAYGEGVP